jgi:hypothetical protein
LLQSRDDAKIAACLDFLLENGANVMVKSNCGDQENVVLPVHITLDFVGTVSTSESYDSVMIFVLH